MIFSNEHPVDFLGGGYVIRNIKKGLSALGHTVELYGPTNYYFFSSRVRFAERYRLALGLLLLVAKRWKYFRDFDTIIFLGGISSLSMVFAKKIVGYRGKIIHFSNGPELKYFDLGIRLGVTPKKWYHISESVLSHFSFILPDLIITVSEDDRRWLNMRKFPQSGKVAAINPGLPKSFLGVEIDFCDKKKVIGFCGNWILSKGLKLMMEVVPKVLRENPEWEFWVLGTKHHEIIALSFPHDVRSRIKIFPFIKEKKVLQELYKQVSIQILPSYYESFGLVMLESMACACALVTTRVGLGCELVSGEHALIMEEKTPQALYDHITTLIQDPELLRRLGKGGYAFAQGFTWEKAVGQLNDELHRLSSPLY